MADIHFSSLKKQFYDTCVEALYVKSEELKAEVDQLRLSIANDSKSSMGDKYETSREMMQQEINRLEQQVALTGQQIFNLKTVNLDRKYVAIEKGSLVQTSIGLFFISVSYGEVKASGQSCIMISEFAPLAQLLLKKSVKETIELNKKKITILGIY